MPKEISIVETKGELRSAIKSAVAELGGWGRFIVPGERVLLKPNFNTADPYPASGDAAFIGAVADEAREAGASVVAVGESSAFYSNTMENLQRAGILALHDSRSWLQVLDFDSDRWVPRAVAGGRHFKSVSVPDFLDEFDKLIFLPNLKTHRLSQYTGAIKLSVGLMKPSERFALHAFALQEKVAEVASVVRPHLTIMDARKCLITGGPLGGTVREPGVIVAGTSRIEVDKIGIGLIQKFPGNALAGVVADDLPQIRRAIEMGIDAEPLL